MSERDKPYLKLEAIRVEREALEVELANLRRECDRLSERLAKMRERKRETGVGAPENEYRIVVDHLREARIELDQKVSHARRLADKRIEILSRLDTQKDPLGDEILRQLRLGHHLLYAEIRKTALAVLADRPTRATS